jgi:ATP-binding protein involved in chromosome partitioning
MTAPTPEYLRERLATVIEPTLGRDLISAGLVRDAAVADDEVYLSVDLISPGYPQKPALEASIRAALRDLDRTLTIHFGLNVPRKAARQDLNRLPTVKNIIAVAAGKGGVGKSTVSTNLALALQRLGAKVGMLDADIYGPSLPKMLGTPDSPTDKGADGKITPARYRGMPMMSIDFFVETGKAVIWRGPMIHKLLQQFLEDVNWGDLDYLVIDLPPGTGDAQLSLGQLIPVSGGVIVTTPQEVALLDVRKAVDMFTKLEVPIFGVVENMSYYQCPSCGHHDSIFASGGGKRLADEIKQPLLGQLPIDTRVALGGERGEPIVIGNPEGEHAKIFLDIAANVALSCAKLASTGPVRSSLLRTI